MLGTATAGDLLRHWRTARGLTQLGLALDAGISTRHLSFVETGRSRPSRDVVLALAGVLSLPFRERNALLEASGHSREYPEASLASPALGALDRALGMILDRQEPFGAVVLDRRSIGDGKPGAITRDLMTRFRKLTRE
jgi:transcriptional regulator with XRE-family HTH domain